MANSDYYDILGVPRGSSEDELKRAYRKKAMEFHPDRNPDDAEAEKQFKQVSAAYDVLKDPEKRALYDQYGHDAFAQHAGAGGGFHQGFDDISDIFEEMFSGFMGSSGRRRQDRRQRGEDLRFDLTISLKQAYHGTSEKLRFDVKQQCGHCHGSGAETPEDIDTCPTCRGAGVVQMRQGFFSLQQECPKCRGLGKFVRKSCRQCRGEGMVRDKKTIKVDIPQGVEDGNRIRVSGEGNQGRQGGGRGDLYVFVTVAADEIFERHSTTILLSLPVPMTKAALGDKVDVPTIDGSRVRIDIPAGTAHGQQFRLRGKGMSALYGRGPRGDMMVQARIDIPKNLSKKQRTLLEEFEHETAASAESKNFWQKISEFWKNYEKDG